MKTWIIFVVLGIAELFLLLVQRIFVEKVLTSRGRKPVYEVIAWGFYYFAFGLITYVFNVNVFINLFVFNSLFLGTVLFLYQDKIRYCIYVTIFVYIAGMCAEVITCYLLLIINYYRIGQALESEQFFAGAIISKFICFCLLKIALLFVGKSREKGVHIRDLLEACFVPSGSILIVLIIISKSRTYMVDSTPIDTEGCIGVAILFVINIATYYLYEKGKEAAEKRIYEKALREQCNYYMRQCEESKTLWTELSKFRHDMKQRYVYVQMLLENNRYDALRQYYENIENFLITTRSVASSGNIFFDSILNYKAEIAARDKTEFRLDLEIPHDCETDSEEVSICLGNLIDNGMEAVRGLESERRWISIKSRVQGYNLYIETRNPYDLPRVKKGGDYITTKQDVRSHGWGLQIIREIVERYHGEIEITEENQEFCVKILLFQIIK